MGCSAAAVDVRGTCRLDWGLIVWGRMGYRYGVEVNQAVDFPSGLYCWMPRG